MAASGMFHLKFDEICRLCLKQDDFLSSIFETDEPEDSEPLLQTRIASIAPVQIEPEDGLPDLICHTCRDQVEKCYNFRLLVEISDRTLRACMETAKNVDPNRLVVKQEVPEVEEKIQQFLLDNNLTDSSAVSVILVETENGTQVLNICSVNDNEDTEKAKDDAVEMHSDGDNQDSTDENRQDSNDSDIDDLKGIQRFLKTEKTDNTMRLTQANEELSGVLMMNENCMVDEEEDQESVPELNCQLCSKTFRSLLDLKNHISKHFVNESVSESIGDTDSPGEESQEAQEDAENTEEDVTGMKEENSQMKQDEEEEEEEDEEDALMNFNIRSIVEKEKPNGDDDLSLESKMLWKINKTDVKVHPTMFRCARCFRKFNTSSSLKNHERIHKNVDKFVCATCGKCFTKRSVLRYHEGTHVEKPPECAVCKKLFMNMQSFKMHMKRHVLGSRFACNYCAKRYYTNSELSRHVQTHLGKRAYPCELCETSFFSQPELNRHLKYHKGEKKFTCKVCYKSYFESGHLKIHERVHTGEKPFACTICNKAFFTKPKLVRHTKTHMKNQRDVGEDGADRRRNEDTLETIL